jgi:hypothetical protein
MSLYITCVISAALFLLFVAYLLRKDGIKEGFAVLWFGSAAMVLVLAIFPQIARSFSNLLGIALPSNLVFFFAILLLVMVSLVITHEIGKLQEKVLRLAQEVAILRGESEQ